MFKKFLAAVVMLSATLAMAAVDINKASDADLDGIKGIGPATSKLIATERKKGEFKDWNDLISRVKGIGEARATKLSAEGLTVNGAAFKAVSADAKTAKKDDKKEDKPAPKK